MALSLAGLTVAEDAASTEVQQIHSFEGNLSEKNIGYVDMLSLYSGLGIGEPGLFIAEAVKFKAPKSGWKVKAVQVMGWDGYNGSIDSVPFERVIGLEIRDKDLNLLYKLADSQVPYTNYARNYTGIYPILIEVPSIPVSDDFYVCFYDRGAITVAFEFLNETSDNSFIYTADGLGSANNLLTAKIPTSENTSLPVNWIMTVVGS